MKFVYTKYFDMSRVELYNSADFVKYGPICEKKTYPQKLVTKKSPSPLFTPKS